MDPGRSGMTIVGTHNEQGRMTTMTGIQHRFLHQYLVCITGIILAVGLWLNNEYGFSLFALLVTGTGFYSVRYLLQLVAASNKQKFFLDQQLIQSQKLASIGELSSGIAHEINNPLAIIGQEAEWMRHLLKEGESCGSERYEDLQDSLQEIVRQVDRCKDITHKLLDFARKKDPLMQTTDLNKLIEDMVKLVEKEAVHKHIILVRKYGPDMPSVYTDPPLLRQVVLNLLNNAVYAIGQDGSITVATRTGQNDSAIVEIKDTGCGIAKEHLSKIFDPFFTTKPQGKGTGLGLSICHGIVTKLGGRISVESAVGEGTTFFVDLPLKQRKGEEQKCLRGQEC